MDDRYTEFFKLVLIQAKGIIHGPLGRHSSEGKG